MGLIHRWSRLAAPLPCARQFVAQTPGFGVAKWVGWHRTERADAAPTPRKTFRSWFRKRRADRRCGPPRILWPERSTITSARRRRSPPTRVLEAAGFEVAIPAAALLRPAALRLGHAR